METADAFPVLGSFHFWACTMLKRKFYKVEINLQEEKRIAKRKRDNTYKDEIEKKKKITEVLKMG